MKGIWREAKTHGRVKSANLLGDADPDQVYDTCRGCGNCMHLNKAGYCGEQECSDVMFTRAQAAGLIYKFADLVVYNRDTVAHMKPPPVPEHTREMLRDRGLIIDPLPECAEHDCTTIPRPNDALCIKHRLEENVRLAAKDRKRNQNSWVSDDSEAPERKRKRRHKRARRHIPNQIRGLDDIKLK